MSQPSAFPRARRFCFTLANPSEDTHYELANIQFICPDFRYLIYQVEKAPTTGTEHIQAYLELNAVYRFQRVLSLLPDGSHVESARGTCQQNILYCSKADSRVNGPFEYGTPSVRSQGRRSDLLSLMSTLETATSLEEAVLSSESNQACYVKYHRGLEKLASLKKKPISNRIGIQPRRVCVIWGPTGTGKTHTAYTSLQTLYPEEEPFICPCNSGQWFDGYNGQRGVIFDDFRAQDDNMPVSTFLRIFDKYPLTVPIKGGFVQWSPETIYLTTNINPASFYSNQPEQTYQAVQRRLTEVSELTQPYAPQLEEKTE